MHTHLLRHVPEVEDGVSSKHEDPEGHVRVTLMFPAPHTRPQ